MHTACDKRVDDRFVLDFPYGIAIANPFLIADDSDQILGHRLGYVCRIPLAVSNAMQCFRCYPLLMPKGHQTLKNWKWLFKPCFTQTMLMRKHSSMFSRCTHIWKYCYLLLLLRKRECL
jgi:hypothetical protein